MLRKLLQPVLAYVLNLIVQASVRIYTKFDATKEVIRVRFIVTTRFGEYHSDWFDFATLSAKVSGEKVQ